MPVAFPLQFARYREIAAGVAALLKRGAGSAELGADLLAPWPSEVIVASAGVAEAIAREVGPHAGLQLQTLEELARRIINARGEFPRVASEAERRLAMRTAARSVDDPLMETRGIAAMLERSYRDMRDSGVVLGSVRLRRPVVTRAWREYERLIAALGAIDPAELFALAARDVSGVKPQIVAGFYDMTGAQWGLVEALAEAGKVEAFFIPSEEPFAQGFIHRVESGRLPVAVGQRVHPATGNRPPATSESPAPKWEVREYERRDVEVRETCNAIAQLIAKGVPAREIGIVTRALDDYDIHLFHRYATFPLSRAESTPLLAHRLGRAIATLLRIRERGFPRGEVLELVRDGISFDTRINIDAADRDTRAERIAGGTSEELRRRGRRRPTETERYIELVAEIETLAPNGAKRGSEWSAWLSTVASRFRIEAEVDLAAAERIDAIADLFRRAEAMRTAFDAAAVLDALENESIERRSQPDAVWLGDVMKFRGRTFTHLFAVRMQDDSFPQRRTEDPLVPDSERRTLGIREIGDGRDEERLLFQLLFDGTTSSITFSFSSSDGFGKILRPSQLVKNFVVEQRPSEKAALLKNFDFRLSVVGCRLSENRKPTTDNRQLITDNLRQLQLLARSATNREFDGFIADSALRAQFVETAANVSPTRLEDFGECPQKFLLKHLLGVTDIDDPERELQIHHREKGSIDHRILETFYRSLTDADYETAQAALPQVPHELLARLERAIDAEFDRMATEAPPFNENIRAIERRATKRILRDFIARDLTDVFESGFRPKYFEHKFERGRIDRIDSDGTRLRVIDYKSGKALRHVNLAEKIDRGVRLQLAVYAMRIAELFETDPMNVVGAIKPLAGGEAKPQSFAFVLGEKRAALEETLAIFSRAIAAGRFPAFPNEKDFDSCKYCPVNHSCRTRHDAEEKYAVLQLRDPRTLLLALETQG
jgi:PD-(D/E)XK nuclease superfamily protein